MKQLAAMAVLQVLWFLLTPTVAFFYIIPVPPPLLAAASGPDVAAPPPVVAGPRPGCPSMCGNVNIPYPFGIRVDCARPGIYNDFTITCNHSFSPPRPYWGNIEVISISLEAGEMRVFSPVSYICYNSNSTADGSMSWTFDLGTFVVSPTRNIFTGIGCDTLALLAGREDRSYCSGCYTSCMSLRGAAQDGEECTGLGCCQTSVPSNLTAVDVYWGENTTNLAWGYSPCNYAFIAEKGWYHFRRRDLPRLANKTFADYVGNRAIPMVLDWAITDGGSCQAPSKDAGASAKPTAPACISSNSICVNATQGRPGYLCNCSEGYTGNPYIADGCTNINECNSIGKGPCGIYSTCEDTQGDYICKCKFNRKGDGKSEEGCYQYVVPLYAISIAVIFVFLLLLALLLWVVRKEKKQRQRRGYFEKNGGKLLERVQINFYTFGGSKNRMGSPNTRFQNECAKVAMRWGQRISESLYSPQKL